MIVIIIIIIITIIIIILVLTFIIYNYVPEEKQVPSAHSIAAVLYLQSVLHVMLFGPKYILCIYINPGSSVGIVTELRA